MAQKPRLDIDKLLDAHPRVLPMLIERLSPNGDVQIITTNKPVSITSQFNAKVVGVSERGRKVYETLPVNRNDFTTLPVLHGRLSAFSEDELRQRRADLRQAFLKNGQVSDHIARAALQ